MSVKSLTRVSESLLTNLRSLFFNKDTYGRKRFLQHIRHSTIDRVRSSRSTKIDRSSCRSVRLSPTQLPKNPLIVCPALLQKTSPQKQEHLLAHGTVCFVWDLWWSLKHGNSDRKRTRRNSKVCLLRLPKPSSMLALNLRYCSCWLSFRVQWKPRQKSTIVLRINTPVRLKMVTFGENMGRNLSLVPP